MSNKLLVRSVALALLLSGLFGGSGIASQRVDRGGGTSTPSSPTRGEFGWTRTSSLNFPRIGHTTTLLKDGRVLVTGGVGNTVLNGGEVFNPVGPAAPFWQLTHGPSTERTNHTATQLIDGRVLIVGGATFSGPADTAELWDPVSDQTMPTGAMSVSRVDHTASLLADGRVLVTGGSGPAGDFRQSAEIYDPATGTWALTGSLGLPRVYHSATRLNDGRVLVVGGLSQIGVPIDPATTTSEVFDPSSNTFSPLLATHYSRARHSDVCLSDGRVLVAGGESDAAGLMRAELFDPDAHTWTDAGTTELFHLNDSLVLLPDGRALIVGGIGFDVSACEFFSPATLSWTRGPDLNLRREQGSVVLLADNRVFIAGGNNTAGFPLLVSEAEVTTAPVGIGAGVCLVDDASGDTFFQVTDRGNELYGWWYYGIAATGEQISGRASSIQFLPGRSLVSQDRDYSAENPTYFMSVRVSYGSSTGVVQVRNRQNSFSRVLRDRDIRNNAACN